MLGSVQKQDKAFVWKHKLHQVKSISKARMKTVHLCEDKALETIPALLSSQSSQTRGRRQSIYLAGV